MTGQMTMVKPYGMGYVYHFNKDKWDMETAFKHFKDRHIGVVDAGKKKPAWHESYYKIKETDTEIVIDLTIAKLD